MANPPFDPYGNPIPANPGAKRVTDADGTTYPIRSNLAVSGITVTDDPATDTTSITASGGAEFTEAGTAMVEAADASAQRALLSIADAADLRAYAISRAKTLLGLTTNPTVVVDDAMFPIVGRHFNSASGSGTTTYRTDRPGGWMQLSTTTTASRARAAVNAEMIASGGTGCVVDNIGASKWYQMWLFSVDTAIDAAAIIELGWINTAFSADEPTFGMLGSAGTTKFRAKDGTAGVNSSVNLDTGIHYAEHYGNGAGGVYLSIDGETAVTYTTAKTAACIPFAQIANGATAANRAVSVGHLVVVIP